MYDLGLGINLTIFLDIILLFSLFGSHTQLCVIKGELREIQIYFRKIPLHQQKFLLVSVLFNSPWLPSEKFEKTVQNETTKPFSVGNTSINISTNQG